MEIDPFIFRLSIFILSIFRLSFPATTTTSPAPIPHGAKPPTSPTALASLLIWRYIISVVTLSVELLGSLSITAAAPAGEKLSTVETKH